MVVGDSPVVPESTRPSQPASTRWVATRAAVAVSSEPSALNGVTIAVSTVPSRAATSNPLVLTATKITSLDLCSMYELATASSLRGQTGWSATSVPSASAAISKSEKTCGCDVQQLAQARDRQPRISTSACSLARIAMKCRQAR